MKKVYICHPYANAPFANMAKVKEIARDILAGPEGYIPIAPHLYVPQLFSEQTERDQAMEMCLKLLLICDEVWVYGSEFSPGMLQEMSYASATSKTLVFKGVP